MNKSTHSRNVGSFMVELSGARYKHSVAITQEVPLKVVIHIHISWSGFLFLGQHSFSACGGSNEIRHQNVFRSVSAIFQPVVEKTYFYLCHRFMLVVYLDIPHVILHTCPALEKLPGGWCGNTAVLVLVILSPCLSCRYM